MHNSTFQMYQKGGCHVSFIQKKIKNQNAYSCKLKKNKRAAVSFSKSCRSEIFVTQKKLLRTLKIQYKIFDNSLQNLGKGKRQKVKNSIFGGLLIVNQPFSQTECYSQIRFCTYYVFSLNQMSDIRGRRTKKLQTFSRLFF